MQQSLRFALATILLLVGFTQTAQGQQNFSTSKRPDWVQDINFNERAMPIDTEEAAGFYVLLVDKQFDVAQQAYYRNYAVKILNEKGLQEEGDLSIVYDPSYQHLSFHTVAVLRNGEIINKLNAADFKIIQREAEAAQKLYDGRLSALLHVKDLRVGDVLSYSYTIKGRNPVYKGLFFEDLYWQFNVPVAKLFYRIFLPTGRNLNLREIGKTPKPTISQLSGQQVYSWIAENLTPLNYESQIPSWYDPAPFTQLSEFENWGKVTALFATDYKAAQAITDASWQALSKTLFTPEDSEETKITRLLHFVQNDIRYLGLENGISAYKPYPPAQVLQQKYGDCKDKALLLCALLHKLGIEAYPALVNTYQRAYVKEQLPNPGAFNHCIVRMHYGDSTYWFDATINSQGGTFKTVSLPNYQQALVMKEGENGLSPVTDYLTDQRHIKEYYVIKKGADTDLTIMSRYKGFESELQRSHFRNTSLREIEKSYMNYYAGLYPGIALRKSLKFRDREEEFETEENYTIKDIWETSTERAENKVASFYPLYLNEFLVVPDKKLREMPYVLNYPLQVKEEIILEMPERWGVEEDKKEVSNEFFTFTYQVNYQHPVITIQYSYTLHKDHVPANQIASYIKEVDKVKKMLGYEIYYADTTLPQDRQLSIPLVVLTLVMLLVFIAAALILYQKYDPKPLSPVTSYNSIGGWLFIPVIGLVTTPVRVLYSSISWDYFNATVLHQMFEASSPFYNPMHGAVLVIELLFNLAITVMAVLLLVLMFNRRSSLPKLFTIYLASNFVFLLLELLILEGANIVERSALGESYMQLGQSLIGCLIWVPYFNISERVKETFTVRQHAKAVEVDESIPVTAGE